MSRARFCGLCDNYCGAGPEKEIDYHWDLGLSVSGLFFFN